MKFQCSASFTAEPLEKPLRFLVGALDATCDVAFSPLNQLVQQLLDPQSDVRQAKACEQIFLLRPRDIAAEDPREGLRLFEGALLENGASLNSPVTVLVCPHPLDSAADLQDQQRFVNRLRDSGHLAFTSESLLSLHGDPADVYDREANQAGQVPFTETMFAAVALRIARQVQARSVPCKKLIVVDADHTLWRGVLGEDGVDGVEITQAHAALQRFLLERKSQGILLAISSKNEADDVTQGLEEIPGMLLKAEDFVAQCVNWRPKSENVLELCERLELGSDSVIFIDDNPAEVGEVASACPEAVCLALPEDLDIWSSFLQRHPCFDLGMPTTAEDRSRSELYQAKASREGFRKQSDSFVEFLAGLELEVDIAPIQTAEHERVAQLSTRTNQFNACKAPFTAAVLSKRLAAGDFTFQVRASDRFGDYGLVGAMLGKVSGKVLTVDAFFLSCRALGKGVERRMIRRLGEEALASQVDTVRIQFQDAERNGVCRRFFEEIGAVDADGAFEFGVGVASSLDPLPSKEFSTGEAPAKVDAPAETTMKGQFLQPEWLNPFELAKQLAAERQPRPDLDEVVMAPRTELEKRLLSIWEAVLGLEGLGVEDRFIALGGKSLQLVQMHARLVRELEVTLPLTDLFELPTVRALANRLENGAEAGGRQVEVSERKASEPIAIVGMALRTPGADSVETFWENLRNGVDSLHHFSNEELASADVDAGAVRQDPNYVPVKGLLDGIDQFDASFFGILPKEAKYMDPQHRLFLELAWEALERAGYDPNAYSGKIGVWAGAYLDTYVIANLCTDKEFHANWIPAIQVGSLQTELGNDKDYLATRVSFKLNLRGPSMTVQTACSTSMVAISQAIQSLRAGESDMALAGGITITLPEKKGYYYTEDGMLSKDGRVCTFSDEATGTVFGNGTGIVVLKKLSDAQRDGDHIHALIKGAALNNDGGVKHSYTAPSVDGQMEVVTMAQSDAGVTSDSIGYIEAHGTGTPLGDPIEVAALTKCFRRQTDKTGYCVLGSLKPNVGHLDVASGVCGVIKTALTLENREIPPLLNYQRPNPKIDFEESPFRVETKLTPWESDGPRRAAVSSFGVGGTNGHVVLEEAPEKPARPAPVRPAQLFLISARTESARDEATDRLARFSEKTTVSFGDAAFTTVIGRRAFAKRRLCVAKDWATLGEKLSQAKVISGTPMSDPTVNFMFPGQGAQHVGMARELYDTEPVFRDHIDACATYLLETIGADLRDVLYPEVADEAATDRLKQTLFAQPAIFVIETGLASLWKSWGVNPQAMIGHSVGEFAAACLAGVFSLEEGLDILAKRGQLMGDLPGGAMLSVRLSEDAIEPYLGEADLAAVNGKELCVLAGSHEVIGDVEARLEADGVTVKHLHTSHGFHSRMMDPVIDPFAAEIAKASLKAPEIPIFSTVSGAWLTDEEACDPHYWARHLRQPVRFCESIQALAATKEPQIFVEVGPGQTLATLARQSVGREGGHQFCATGAHASGGGSDYEQLLETLGRLWTQGVTLDWESYFSIEPHQRAVLPPYPFERKRHWVEAQSLVPSTAPLSNPAETPAKEALPITMPSPMNQRRDLLAEKMREILSELSDIPEEELDGTLSFLELGFDSLLLTQVSKAFQDAFSAKVTMRQLIDELPTIDALTAHLDATLDPSIMAPEAEAAPAPIPAPAAPTPVAATPPPAPAAPVPAPAAVAPIVTPAPAAIPMAPTNSVTGQVIQQQMDLMRQQLALLQGTPAVVAVAPLAPEPVVAPVAVPAAASASPPASKPSGTEPAPTMGSTAHGPYKPINRKKDEALSDKQRQFIEDLTKRYNAKTRRSKERTQQYRHCFADPRTANGFNRLWKDMCYQILVERAKGSRLTDVDGNEYIDIVNGFGPGFLGHSPDFVTEALQEQLGKTIAVGPQSELAGETSELVCKLIGADRVCFLNTGSEAVQAAMRLARTVTGRDKIVVFSKDYHGNFDEVLVKGANRNGKFKTLPIAPGIPRRAVEDVLVLEYGTEESLQIIREQADQLAAVMVEPMQSRRPEFQPKEFITELRSITEQNDCLFIFDEVITGFRTGPGGAQEFYGVKADLATYGKVIGGGMPVGLVAGKREYMDTFDGGMWQYGDESFPEAPVTFFAGTFVRHPLAVAAVNVMAKFFLEQPRSFWDTIYGRAARLAGSIDQFFVDEGIGIRMAQFSSQMFVRVSDEEKYGGLLFCQLREKGVFILEGLPCYLTASHSEEDVDYVINAFRESVADMRAGGFFGGGEAGSRLGKLQGPSRQMDTVPTVAPLTAAQQEIWLACHLDRQASCAYNEATTLHMRGAARFEYIEEAINEIVDRHDALRATFSEDGREVRFARSLQIDLPVRDLTSLSEAEKSEQLDVFKRDEATTPLDLVNGPLLRGFIVKLGAEESVLFLTGHHIVCDGWSYNVLLEELSALYGAKCRGESIVLPAPVEFSRYASAKHKLGGDEEVMRFWEQRFAEAPDPINLPTDRPHPVSRSFAGATERRVISPEASKALKRVGARQKCTAFQTLLGTFEVLLAKLTGQSDFVIGTPAAGQSLEDNTTIVGHAVNFLPLRADVISSRNFKDHLTNVRERVLESFDHQDFTYGELLPRLDLSRSTGRMPLVEVEFNVERTDYHDEFHGLTTVFDSVEKAFVNFPIFINIIDSKDGLVIDCDYKKDLFDGETIQRWLGYFENLIEQLAQSAEAPLADLSLLNASEEQKLIREWNATEKDLGPASCLHALVQGPSGKVAVSQGDETLTYQELDEQSNAIAARLQALAVSPDDLVAVFLDRHPRTVAALLGVLKAGCAYVPLDPGFPMDRLEMMLDDAAPRAVLTTEDLQDRLPKTTAPQILVVGEQSTTAVTSSVDPSHLAYQIYTSGSTGKPKGVAIEHAAIVNFLRSMGEAPGLGSDDVLVAVTTLCFDISLLELFLPLIQGARVEIATRAQATNPELLVQLISQCEATHLQATPVTWRLLKEVGWNAPTGFRMLCGGERMPLDVAVHFADSAGELWNLYGPTETTVWSTVARCEPNMSSIHVGRPIANTTIFILDDQNRPVPIGLPGRLFIGGHGLARGYAKRPELTAEKFIPNPFEGTLGERLYDTGDLARYRKDGTIECLGRSDNQIKFNGYRIELGDIESAMRGHPQVENAAAKLFENEGVQTLAGYVIPQTGQSLDLDSLRQSLKANLPDYMVPGEIQTLESFPLTPNRKIDRRALPEISKARVEVVAENPTPAPTFTKGRVAKIWEELLGSNGLSRQANFFDVGGHSLLLLRLKNRLQETFQVPVELAELFQHTTIESQERLFQKRAPIEVVVTTAAPAVADKTSNRSKDIAVIGMSGRFPGAPDLETFWSNLRDGIESIRDLTVEELQEAGVPKALLSDPRYVKRAGLIDASESFDCQLFGISPREAELMDLQHRIFLEECYKALENGGYDPARYDKRIGVFAGSGEQQAMDPDSLLPSDYYAALTGSQPDYLTTRVAYRLNLKGPSLTVQTGCSTSLVALHIAAQNLHLGECEMALAGGITLISPQTVGYLYEEGMMLSPDGHCRAFDAEAHGTVFSQGAGVVLLKPLDAALRDGDTIRAVIRGSAINNDGSDKIGFTAPGLEGQVQVIGASLAQQGVDPSSIGLLETHGTGTPLGDPIELSALTQAYRKHTKATGFCALGTLKSNVGHMDAAAGIGSFIKAVLALEHRQIPPAINYAGPNAKIDLENSPFMVPTKLVDWEVEPDGRRRAGVSSFGIGGTNAHVILEEAPEVPQDSDAQAERDWQVMPFSAKSKEALQETVTKGLQALSDRDKASAAEIAATLQLGRREYAHREVRLVSESTGTVRDVRQSEAKERPVVFMFPGQGNAFQGMGKDLYTKEAAFRKAVDECERVLKPLLGWSLVEALFGSAEVDWSATDRAQPALFVVEYAMARLWKSWGVEADAMIGHSIGEYVAACLAEVFSLRDALLLVVERGKLMQAMNPGQMLAIGEDQEIVGALLDKLSDNEGIVIAVENSPRSTVVSGTVEAIARIEELLVNEGLEGRRLKTSHAFHSPMMEAAATTFRRLVSTINRQAPSRPYVSNLTGQWVTSEQVLSVDYWCQHLRQAVRFSSGIRCLTEELGDALFLELGPGHTLSHFVRQHGRGPIAVASMRHVKTAESEEEMLVSAVGRYWASGGALNWEAFHGRPVRRVPFPGYAMQRRDFGSRNPRRKTGLPGPVSSDWSSWLHEVRWERVRPVVSSNEPEECPTLLLGDSDRLRADAKWKRQPLADWRVALQDFPEGKVRIIVDVASGEDVLSIDAYEQCQSDVLDRLVALASAMQAEGRLIDLVVVTPGSTDLEGLASGNVHASGLFSACLSLQQDLPNVRCRFIDRLEASTEAKPLAQALDASEYEPLLAIRGRGIYRPEYVQWEQREDSLALLDGSGAIVITGGFGSIGLTCAEMLLDRCDAPIILVGRLRMSPISQAVGPISDLQGLPEAVRAFAEKSERVHLYRADVSQRADVDQLLHEVESLSGGVLGVIHAAGVVSDLPLVEYDMSHRQEIQAGKVHGAIHLANALAERSPKFVLLISSISTVLGGVGYTAYASANAFLDGLAAREDGVGDARWLSLGLDAVSTVGHESPNEMTTAQAAEIVGLHLSSETVPSRLVVSRTAIAERLKTWVHGMAKEQSSNVVLVDVKASPESHVEKIQEVWGEVLKLDSVRADDNFFELGGDSIAAIPMFQRLGQAFGTSLPIATLFRASTPNLLAEEFGKFMPETSVSGCANGTDGSNGRRSGSHDQTVSPFSRQLVIQMKEGDAEQAPIFFNHPGGGSIVFYHEILDVMQHQHPMYGIESPLLSQRRFNLTGMETIEEVARGYTDLVRQIHPNGPYVFAGYSFGGLVSLEMSRILHEEGEDVHLLILDTPNPAADFHTNKLSERIAHHWRREGRLGEKLVKMSKRATQGVVGRVQMSVTRASARRMNETETPSKSAKILNFQILEIYDVLTEKYDPKPFPGNMHLFVAEDHGDKVAYDQTLGWESIVEGQLEITKVPGSHLTLFEKGNASAVVKAMEESLTERFQSRPELAR